MRYAFLRASTRYDRRDRAKPRFTATLLPQELPLADRCVWPIGLPTKKLGSCPSCGCDGRRGYDTPPWAFLLSLLVSLRDAVRSRVAPAPTRLRERRPLVFMPEEMTARRRRWRQMP